MHSALPAQPAYPSAVRSGLALGGLFGWLLTFPMFGPILFDLTGPRAPLLGLIFVTTHGAAMLAFIFLPKAVVNRPSLIRMAGGLLALVSLTFAAAPKAALSVGVPALMLGESAPMVLPEPDAHPLPDLRTLLTRFLPGIAFALGAFLVGGIWYHIIASTPAPEWQWRPVAESLIYTLGVILFGDQARRDRPGMMALYSLSLLGLAMMTAMGTEGELTTIYRALFLLGLAGADLFYWHYLWRVRGFLGIRRGFLGIRRTLGWGLGLSLWLIAFANMTSSLLPVTEKPGTLFLIIPAAHGPAPQAQRSLEPPPGLTQSERQVYDMLVKGAGDADIATALYITRHTVKFHVRNILHKVGVENRKGLLSRLVTGPTPHPGSASNEAPTLRVNAFPRDSPGLPGLRFCFGMSTPVS